jgi:hypothetical protein
MPPANSFPRTLKMKEEKPDAETNIFHPGSIMQERKQACHNPKSANAKQETQKQARLAEAKAIFARLNSFDQHPFTPHSHDSIVHIIAE